MMEIYLKGIEKNKNGYWNGHDMGKAKIALFEGKTDAEKYRKMMEEKGHKVSLNKWTWRVEIGS